MSWSAALRLALLQRELGATLDVATHETLHAFVLLEPNVAFARPRFIGESVDGRQPLAFRLVSTNLSHRFGE